ncbi:hypothetical protein Sru01_51060 [Sphaerisporangium rufum]|uniref:Histidine kinase/HSP90-like ATPase domain-containing protein n=1 Tax=Sphaerisporangium rufum TaxID=1381558 RepID=A0A919R5P5_9ACTN|nr:ATP-binding protein [Sphaerisporangium rufum]GII80124.1 hypothetical protein Sru01_51060 [Sphaerisporangium rufum]
MTAHLARRQTVVRGEPPWWLPGAIEHDQWRPAGRELPVLGRAATSIKTARDFTVAALEDWGLGELACDARLVVSELVTNAMRHAGQATRIRLLHRAAHVVCAVYDPAARPPVLTRAADLAESGRGLYLVESVSTAWGWQVLGGPGKLVWAAFRAPLTLARTSA